MWPPSASHGQLLVEIGLRETKNHTIISSRYFYSQAAEVPSVLPYPCAGLDFHPDLDLVVPKWARSLNMENRWLQHCNLIRIQFFATPRHFAGHHKLLPCRCCLARPQAQISLLLVAIGVRKDVPLQLLQRHSGDREHVGPRALVRRNGRDQLVAPCCKVGHDAVRPQCCGCRFPIQRHHREVKGHLHQIRRLRRDTQHKCLRNFNGAGARDHPHRSGTPEEADHHGLWHLLRSRQGWKSHQLLSPY
mmetsp:Transcript_24198/g.55232  ORF Transcript_24198/g.55232 Transcript_24198/m.55232 type:complete len:247 (-) Transcript_24198:2121-2861(-)